MSTGLVIEIGLAVILLILIIVNVIFKRKFKNLPPK